MPLFPPSSPPAAADHDNPVDWNPAERISALSRELVSWPSETGTPDEAAIVDRIVGLLRSIPYFQEHPEDIVTIDSHGSPMTKSIVAVIRGTGRRALALAGHFDTVATDNYRDLKHLACRPDALKAALLDDLSSRPLAPYEEAALNDLASGDFIPGRGMLDMKSGIAAGIGVLEHFSKSPDRNGNLILMLTPDEERNSKGMRSLRDALPQLAEDWRLDIAASINLDATSDQGNGENGRAIYLGSIGKLLPYAFVIGQPSHASYPFEGISAHLISARIMHAMEVNSDLCDRGAGEVSPPPVCLEAKDFRGGYEVTTPNQTWLAFNWLSHRRSPEELFSLFGATVKEALESAIERFEHHRSAYDAMTGSAHTDRGRAGQVLTINELRNEVFKAGGEAALQRIATLEETQGATDNPLTVSRMLTEAMVAEARLSGPAVVIGFGSLHYPHMHVSEQNEPDRRFLAAIERARLTTERRFGMSICYRQYFTGISDMSFQGFRPEDSDSEIVAANTPASLLVDEVPSNVLRYPVVNIGPWGREFHQRLERVHAPYAFSVLPRFLFEIAGEFLDNPV